VTDYDVRASAIADGSERERTSDASNSCTDGCCKAELDDGLGERLGSPDRARSPRVSRGAVCRIRLRGLERTTGDRGQIELWKRDEEPAGLKIKVLGVHGGFASVTTTWPTWREGAPRTVSDAQVQPRRLSCRNGCRRKRVSWRERDWAKWTDAERRRFYGTTRSTSHAPAPRTTSPASPPSPRYTTMSGPSSVSRGTYMTVTGTLSPGESGLIVSRLGPVCPISTQVSSSRAGAQLAFTQSPHSSSELKRDLTRRGEPLVWTFAIHPGYHRPRGAESPARSWSPGSSGPDVGRKDCGWAGRGECSIVKNCGVAEKLMRRCGEKHSL
jgi:hypothetical protein